MINIFQPTLGNEELRAIADVFASNWIGKGKKTAEFEKNFHEWLKNPSGKTYSVACCTSALFQLIENFDIKSGDEVILPTVSFIGAANAIAHTGAKPVFCDVDSRTLNATVESIEEKITSKTKAVIILHYGGYPCEMDGIIDLCKTKNIICIEDAATSVASVYKGRACGTMGEAGTWSFDAMKILVTGDGGMVHIKDEVIAEKFLKNTYLGLLSKSGISNSVDSKWWEFDINCYGRRDIINDITAAIGIEQLKKLPANIQARKNIHDYYNDAFKNNTHFLVPPDLEPYMESSYYMYWIQLESEDERNSLANYLRQQEIYTTFRYYPLHQVPFFKYDGRLPHAESASLKTLCIPMHQALTSENVAYIVDKILKFWG